SSDLRFPFFGGNKSTIQKSLGPFDFLFRIHSTQQCTPNPLPRPVFRPLLQSPPTGGGRTILPGHVRPSTTGFQDVENSVQGFSRICGRTSGSRFGFGKNRFNHSHCSSVSSCLVLILPFYIGRSCF